MSVQIRCADLTALDDAGTVVASKLGHASSNSLDKTANRGPPCSIVRRSRSQDEPSPPEPSPWWLKVVFQCVQKALVHLRNTVVVNVGRIHGQTDDPLLPSFRAWTLVHWKCVLRTGQVHVQECPRARGPTPPAWMVALGQQTGHPRPKN